MSEVLTPYENDIKITPSRVEGVLSDTAAPAARALEKFLAQDSWQKEDEIRYAHQEQAMGAIKRGLRKGENYGHVTLPTATGKTYLIAKLSEAFTSQGLRVLILAPTIPIAEQIGNNPTKGIRRFSDTIRPSDIGLQYNGNKAYPGAPVVVSTYQSLNRFAVTEELGRFDVILADEAHRSLGPVTQKSLTSYCPEATKIGFTATPDYGLDKKVDQILPKEYYRYDIRAAIEEGAVSPVQALIYATGAEIPLIDQYRKDFTDKELARLIRLKSRNDRAIEIARDLVSDGRQGFIACVPGEDMYHAKLLANELGSQEIIDVDSGQKRKIKARAVTGAMYSEERADILREYEAGNIDVLTFVQVLGEGWDTTRASFGINTCPTTSIVKIRQLLGRGLRPKAKELIFVDFYDESVKKQVTALHALGEEKVNLGKVVAPLGWDWQSPIKRRTYLMGIFSKSIWDGLTSLDSRLVKDIKIRKKKTEFERELQKWNAILAGEGMPEEPVDTLRLPKYAFQALEKYRKKAIKSEEFVVPGTPVKQIEDLIDEDYHGGRDTLLNAWEIFNLSETKDSPLIDSVIPANPHELGRLIDATNPGPDIFDTVRRILKIEAIKKSLYDLPEREQIILRMRFDTTNPATLDEIGREIDVTRERVRQLEGQALSRLSGSYDFSSAASEPLEGKITENLPSRKTGLEKRLEYINKRVHSAKLRVIQHVVMASNYIGSDSEMMLRCVKNPYEADKALADYHVAKFVEGLYSYRPSSVLNRDVPRILDDYGFYGKIAVSIESFINAFLDHRCTSDPELLRKSAAKNLRLSLQADIGKGDYINSMLLSEEKFTGWLVASVNLAADKAVHEKRY